MVWRARLNDLGPVTLQVRADRVLTSGTEDVIDDGQRARVAALDGAGLPALRALQPLPGPACPQWPARPRPPIT
jgi:hypothetical protein